VRELSNAPRWVAIGFLCGLACLAGLGAYSIWSATRLGPGLGSDSAAYIAGAQNLASGDGFVWKMGPADVRPITHRPPLYSVLLASFEFLPPSHPVGALIGTRVTGMVLFAATIALTGWLVFRLTRSMVIGLLGAGLVLMLLAWTSLQVSPSRTASQLHEQVPVAAVASLRQVDPRGNLFNDYNWGGYILWELYPAYATFVDGRTDVFSPEVFDDYLRLWAAQPGWEAAIERWEIGVVLLPPRSPLVGALDAAGWQENYRDEQAVVLLRPGPG